MSGVPTTSPPAADTKCHVCGADKACLVCAAVGARRWSPYIVGIGIGVLSWVAFALMGKALGTSTSMVHASGLVCSVFDADHVAGSGANAYYAKEITAKSPIFDWQMFLVLGVLGGAFVAARLARDVNVERVPELWRWRFGPSRWNRYLWAFLGGVVLIFGARMAGGCTSGHGISGGLQMAASSWAFFMAMFVSGVVTAFALFGKEGRNHVG